MSVWEEKHLGDLAFVNPSVISTKDKKKNIKYIDIASVNQGILQGYTNYTLADAPSRARRVVREGDTLFSTVRPNLRAYYYVRKCPENTVASTGFVVLRAKKKESERFIYYLVIENSFVDWLSLVAKGSAYPAVDSNDFKKAKVIVPDIPTQIRIAEILSAYDDAIENNNRRIALLEQAAQQLYREWFVRFRFPGYEKTKFVKGLPEGWEVKRLSEFGRIETGKTPSMEVPEYFGSDYMFVKTPDMHGNMYITTTNEYLSKAGNNAQPRKLLPPNSIMVTCIGSGGIVAINAYESHTNQQINSIIPKNGNSIEWLFFTCKSLRSTIELYGATGTTMTNLSKGKFERIKVLKPKQEVIDEFHEKVAPIFKAILRISEISQNLTSQRNILLPRLMSGKLEV